MIFKLTRHKICNILNTFASRWARRDKVYIPYASEKLLKQLASISRKIQKKGLPKNLVIKKLKNNLGHGIFLHPKAEPIARGDAIAFYAGEVSIVPQLDDSSSDYVFSLFTDLRLNCEEQKLFDPKNRFHPRRLYSIDLDADRIGNFTRFINHSEEPNLEATLFRIAANPYGLRPSPFEIIYHARKTIRPGEQLLICYEGEDKSYWGVTNTTPFPMTPQTFKLDLSLKVCYTTN